MFAYVHWSRKSPPLGIACALFWSFFFLFDCWLFLPLFIYGYSLYIQCIEPLLVIHVANTFSQSFASLFH